MSHGFRRWLAGSLLALAVYAGVPRADAQPPGTTLPAYRPPEGRPAAPPNAPAAPAVRPLASAVTRQGDLLRLNRDVPGEAKPVSIEADHIATWNEGGTVVLLLEGRGLVQQSVVQARFDKAVAYVDLPRYQSTGILHVALYAEGQVRLDTSIEIQDAPRAALDLHTRGEFKLRTLKGKVRRGSLANDPVVVRAKQAGVGPRPAPAAPPVTPPAGAATPAPPPGTLAPVPGVGSLTPAPAGPVRTVGFEESSTPTPPAVETPRTTLPPLPKGPPSSLPRPSANRQTPQPGGVTPPGPPGQSELPAPVPVPGPTPAPAPAPVRGPSPLPVARQVPVAPPAAASAPPRNLRWRIGSRTGAENWNVERSQLDDGRSVITVSNGVVLSVSGLQGLDTLEVEADRAVIWTRGNDGSSPAGGGAGELEFYMAGHVVLRTQRPGSGDRVQIDADEIYYDTRRNVAVALKSRLEIKPTVKAGAGVSITEPVVLTAAELFQTSETTYEVVNSEVFSSKLPSDPGLKLIVARATVEERRSPRTDLFGRPVVNPRTGEQLTRVQNLLQAEGVVATLEGVPFFYTPYLYTDANDPLGPLVSVSAGGNRVFGVQAGLGLDVYKLFGVLPYEGTKWRAYVDYLSRRGPALGTNFLYQGNFFEVDPEEARLFPDRVQAGAYSGSVRLYGIHDGSEDILGAQPPELLTFDPSGFRGRAFWQQSVWDLPGGYDVHFQASKWSDRNFLEQYFKREFDTSPNQATYAFVKQQCDVWAWSALAEAQVNPWVTTTESLPRLDGYVQGLDLFGLLTSHTHATLGYHQLKRSDDPVFEIRQPDGGPTGLIPIQERTTQDVSTGRAAVRQEFSYPVNLGAVTLSPYAKGALIGYTEDLTGDSAGRAWGGLGLKAHMPLTRLYTDVQSELFNLHGLNHKVNLEANYFVAEATERFDRYPQIDRLNDFATDQALREFTPFQPVYNPGVGTTLATSRLYDPQMFAVRRLVDNRFDTLDQIHAVQLEARQRLQTKRGYPGSQHIIDWMSLDTAVTLFPQADRDNFGKPYAFAEYDYLWNIGDRTSFQSSGWYDPNDDGPRVTTVGLYFDRPDRTSFYVGYRQIDPLQSRAVSGAMTYIFSEKYSMTFSVSYDLGQSAALGNSVIFTRTGKDLQVSLGFTYNTFQNNFGAVVEIVPNLAARCAGSGANLLSQGQGNGGGFGR